MKLKAWSFIGVLFPFVASAGESAYCPQNHGYINVGMTEAQVISACGQPISKRTGSKSVTVRIPVKQLIYTTLNRGAVYSTLNPIYQQWSLPSGSTGVTLEVNVVNQKVKSVNINGSSTNAMSLCGGTSVQVGDDESAVYSACGSPDMVNQSYINQPVPGNEKPQVWIYQADQYQQPMSLTFVNGQLKSID